MSDYPKGLRFDIYERFTLSDDVEGIGELEDIELLPRITMQTHEDQAVLSGDLLLTGTYVGVGEQSGVRELSHRIPVEISLPLKRIQRMDSIGIEIENFDVELMSSRSLNITGVISLNGVDASAEQTWNKQGEATFVHEANVPGDEPADDSALRETATASDEEAADAYSSMVAGADSAAPDDSRDAARDSSQAVRTGTADNVWGYPQQDESNAPEPAHQARSEEQDEDASVSVRASDKHERASISMLASEQGGESSNRETQQMDTEATWGGDVSADADGGHTIERHTAHVAGDAERGEAAVPKEQQKLEVAETEKQAEPVLIEEQTKEYVEEALEEAAEAQAEKAEQKEMKIAFGSIKQDSGDWTGSAEGVKSLLSQHVEPFAEEVEEEKEQAAEGKKDDARSLEEAVKWKNLLLSAAQEEFRFSKMRMCIVQREETLETIASRYEMNPKELVLYNRLDSEQVREGQVIYIPG